jgi:hypothetical protein
MISQACRFYVAAFAAAFGLTLLAAPAARAFTLDNQYSTNSDGSAQYVDPAAPASRFGNSNGQTTIRQGNTTLQFGRPQSFDQRFDKDSMFNPNGKPSGER